MDILQRQNGTFWDLMMIMATNTTVSTTLNHLLFSLDESKRQMGHEPFNMAEFKLITDLRKQREYLNGHAMVIGYGSSRIAYGISPKHVVKLAGGKGFMLNLTDLGKVEAGRAQNEAEAENYAKASEDARKVLPRTVSVPTNEFNWIISELVRPVTGYEEMRQLAFGDHQIVGMDGVIQSFGGLFNIMYEAYVIDDEAFVEQLDAIIAISNPAIGQFIENIVSAAKELDLNLYEIRRPIQWGKSADGRLVLLDFGGTEDVLEEYY